MIRIRSGDCPVYRGHGVQRVGEMVCRQCLCRHCRELADVYTTIAGIVAWWKTKRCSNSSRRGRRPHKIGLGQLLSECLRCFLTGCRVSNVMPSITFLVVALVFLVSFLRRTCLSHEAPGWVLISPDSHHFRSYLCLFIPRRTGIPALALQGETSQERRDEMKGFSV